MPIKSIKHKLQDTYAKWAIVTLIVLGVLCITARLLFSDQLQLPYGDTAWTISIEAKLPDAKKGDKISISPPWSLSKARLVSQNLQYTNMHITRPKGSQKRDITLKVENPGDLTFYAEFNVHLSNTAQSNFTQSATSLTTELRSLYLSPEEKIDPTSYEVTQTLKKLSKASTDNTDLIQRIFKLTRNLGQDIKSVNNDANVVLRSKTATTLGRSRAMVALSRAAGIPARVVTGFMLTEELDATPHYWVELYLDNDNKWLPYDPRNGYIKELPSNFLAFNRGNNDSSIVASKDIENIQVTYNIEQNHDLVGLRILKERQVLDIFDLERFPPDARKNIGLLLLLPLGVLITAFFRNIIGIRGYGTFTPTLLALAAVYADWIAALVLLIVVVSFSLSGRSAMPDKLTRIPRLGIMFTIVVMSMVIGISLMDYFRVNPGEHIVLLPIVILTSLIDSFYRAAEDSGVTIAIRRMMWTIAISTLCFPILKLDTLGNLLLVYPETHFITLSLILTISLYKGKRIYEYPLFKWVKEPMSEKAINKKN